MKNNQIFHIMILTNVCIDGLTILYRAKQRVKSVASLSPNLTLEAIERKTEDKVVSAKKRTPKSYTEFYKVYYKNLMWGYVSAVPANFCRDTVRIRFEKGVFYDYQLFKEILQELHNSDVIKYQSIENIDIALNTEEDLVSKFNFYDDGFGDDSYKFASVHLMPKPLKVKFLNGKFGFRLGDKWNIYNKSIELLLEPCDFISNHFKAVGFVNDVFRLEFTATSAMLEGQYGFPIDLLRLCDEDYLIQAFNVLVYRRMRIMPNKKKNRSHENNPPVPFIDAIKFSGKKIVCQKYKPIETISKYSIYWISEAEKLFKSFPQFNQLPEIIKQFKVNKGFPQ